MQINSTLILMHISAPAMKLVLVKATYLVETDLVEADNITHRDT